MIRRVCRRVLVNLDSIPDVTLRVKGNFKPLGHFANFGRHWLAFADQKRVSARVFDCEQHLVNGSFWICAFPVLVLGKKQSDGCWRMPQVLPSQMWRVER